MSLAPTTWLPTLKPLTGRMPSVALKNVGGVIESSADAWFGGSCGGWCCDVWPSWWVTWREGVLEGSVPVAQPVDELRKLNPFLSPPSGSPPGVVSTGGLVLEAFVHVCPPSVVR